MKKQKNKSVGLLIGGAIVVFWIALVGYYISSQMKDLRYTAPPLNMQVAGEDKEVWLGIYLGGRKIGYNHMIMRARDDGYEVLDEAMFRIKLMDQSQKIHIRVQAVLAPDFTIRWVEMEGLEGIANLKARGEVRGKSIEIEARLPAGEVVREAIPFSEPPVLYTPWLLAERIKLQGIRVGDKLTVPSFEPMMRRTYPVQLEVLAEETIQVQGRQRTAYRIRESMAGQEEYLWVSPRGELLKQAHASGFTAVRQTKEQAVSGGWEKEGALDLIAALVVPSNTAVIEPRRVAMLRAELKNVSVADLDLTSDGQTARGNIVTVHRAEGIPDKGYALPIDQSILDAHPELEKYLASRPELQKDSPKIIKAAKQAVAGNKDAVLAARALTEWVSRYVADSMVVTLPNALAVLEQKQGSCKEHTVLYVALARASGLPARMNSGIVYAGNEQLVEGFYYHAWPEVWLAGPAGKDGRFVAVDPTFNQFPADATHIRLMEGGLENSLELLSVVGRLEVEVKEYR